MKGVKNELRRDTPCCLPCATDLIVIKLEGIYRGALGPTSRWNMMPVTAPLASRLASSESAICLVLLNALFEEPGWDMLWHAKEFLAGHNLNLDHPICLEWSGTALLTLIPESAIVQKSVVFELDGAKSWMLKLKLKWVLGLNSHLPISCIQLLL